MASARQIKLQRLQKGFGKPLKKSGKNDADKAAEEARIAAEKKAKEEAEAKAKLEAEAAKKKAKEEAAESKKK